MVLEIVHEQIIVMWLPSCKPWFGKASNILHVGAFPFPLVLLKEPKVLHFVELVCLQQAWICSQCLYHKLIKHQPGFFIYMTSAYQVHEIPKFSGFNTSFLWKKRMYVAWICKYYDSRKDQILVSLERVHLFCSPFPLPNPEKELMLECRASPYVFEVG